MKNLLERFDNKGKQGWLRNRANKFINNTVDDLTGIEKHHDDHAHGMYAPGSIIPDEFVNSGYQWNQPGGDGTPVNITYSYSNLLDVAIGVPSCQRTSAIEEALGLWAMARIISFCLFVNPQSTFCLPSERNSFLLISLEK